VAKSGGTSTDRSENKPGNKVPGKWTKRATVGGDLILDEENGVQPEREKVQREVGEHQQVLQEGEGKQQEEAWRFEDLSLFSPIGGSIQGEEQGGGPDEAGEHDGAPHGAAGAAMASSASGAPRSNHGRRPEWPHGGAAQRGCWGGGRGEGNGRWRRWWRWWRW